MEFKSNLSNAWKFLGIWLILMVLYDGYFIISDLMKDVFGFASLIGPLFLLPLLYVYIRTIGKACYRLDEDVFYIRLPSDKICIPYAKIQKIQMFAGGKARYGLAQANMKIAYMSERGSLEEITISPKKDDEFYNELTKRMSAAKALMK